MLQQAEATATKAETLADRLERGPLPLQAAVRCAYDISKLLRELHRESKTHGSVNCRAIELSVSGAVLLSPEHWLPGDQFRKDIQGFGRVLQALIPEDSEPGVSSELKRMTARCLAEPLEADWAMKHIVSELRLQHMAVRQWENTATSLSSRPKIWRVPEAQPSEEQTVLPVAAPVLPAVPAPKAVQRPVVKLEAARVESKGTSIRCPRCTAADVHPSTPKTHFEDLLVFLKMPLMRCHRCSYRYFEFLGMTISKGAEG